MPRIVKSTVVTLVLFAALAFGAAGSADPGSFARTKAYEFFSGTAESTWCSTDDAARTRGREPHLRGPHFAVSILCSYAGDAVPEAVAAETRELAELPSLATGTDMLLAQMALISKYRPEVEAGAVTVWVQAGAERFDLAELPDARDFVAVTVPAGEDAVLWVEDEGRAQGLSLRAADRVGPVAGYYNDLAGEAEDFEIYRYEKILVRHSYDAWRLTCAGLAKATRHVWSAEHGWAPKGEVFLAVELNWCDDFEEEAMIRWELDQETSIVVRDETGSVSPVDWSEHHDEEEGRLLVTALFEIPAELAAPRVDFIPVGHLENLSAEEDFYFLDTFEATEWTFNF